MHIIHWVVFAYSLVVVHSRYRFRFHTCRKEDQAILDRENLVSLRQMTYIDDGGMDNRKLRRLAEIGIGIDYGTLLKNLTTEYKSGAESAIRVIEFYGTDYFIIINFFHRSYYFMKRGDAWRMSPIDKTIKPSLKHFVRIYFICAPGNARSALILFGDQAQPRKVTKQDGDTMPRPQKKMKREMKELKIGDEIVRKCRKIRKKRGAVKSKKGDIESAIETRKDNRRIEQRTKYGMFRKVALSYAHLGFGIVIALNCIVVFIFFKVFKKALPVKIKEKKKGGGRGGDGFKESATTETKTKSEGQKY